MYADQASAGCHHYPGWMFGFYEGSILVQSRQSFVSLGILMITMLMNTFANSQNTDVAAVGDRSFSLVVSRQYWFIPEGASATLNAHSSLSANWWMA